METVVGVTKSIVIPILVLGLVVLIHELAHFLTALRVGMKVIEFSVFIGPAIWTRVIGGIKYSLRMIPFGGYVRIYGMEFDEPSELASPEAFHNRPPIHRFIVLASGSVANLLIAFLLLVIYGWAITNMRSTNTIARVAMGMPASKAGIKPGDEIIAIDGLRIRLDKEWLEQLRSSPGKTKRGLKLKVLRGDKVIECGVDEVRQGDSLIGISNIGKFDADIIVAAISSSPKKTIMVKVKRNGSILPLKVTPIAQEGIELREAKGKGLKRMTKATVVRRERGIIGIELAQAPSKERIAFHERFITAVKIALSECAHITYGIVMLFMRLTELHEAVGGPIRVFWELKEHAWLSLVLQLRVMGALSYVVGLFNLILPIPPLDGGRITVLIVEAILKHRINRRLELKLTLFGIILLLTLVALISARDIGYILKRAIGTW
ncbi:MAG: hypothetical protein RUDDFDWM_000574 [Candidatus Fervidibacterota bacterium]